MVVAKVADEESRVQTGEQTAETPPPSAPVKRADRFVGTYEHSIDAKGRMIVPIAFRELLGTGFVIGPTMDFHAIALYPVDIWEKQTDELMRMGEIVPTTQRLLNAFAKFSYDGCEIDAQGRILLPAKLRAKMLGDARDLVVSGALNHIRVVTQAQAEREEAEFDEVFPDVLGYLDGVKKQMRQ